MNNLSREELVKLVDKIIAVDYRTEEEGTVLFELLKNNVPDPEVLELIFHHEPELTSEEVIDKALAYKPIVL